MTIPLVGKGKSEHIKMLRVSDVPDNIRLVLELDKEDVLKMLDWVRISFEDFLPDSFNMLAADVIWTASEKADLDAGDFTAVLRVIERLADAEEHLEIPAVFIMRLWKKLSMGIAQAQQLNRSSAEEDQG